MNMEKEAVNNLKTEWKKLWSERVNDKVRAEGIASSDYSHLFVEKGTIIHATRDFRVITFKEILQRHQISNAERFIPPDPSIGGWGVFVRTTISRTNKIEKRAYIDKENVNNETKTKANLQQKKCGKGWLHLT